MAAFPHCDSRILHAPGECRYCDMFGIEQDNRIKEGINFTGHYLPEFKSCPAEVERPLEMIERWHGNVPETRSEEQISADWDKYWAEVTKHWPEVRTGPQ